MAGPLFARGLGGAARHVDNDRFSQFANATAHVSGKPVTFVIAALIVVAWAVTGPLFHYSDTWQLVINTATTIVTFLLVALLQNSQRRSDEAMHKKLDALADGLADLMAHVDSADNRLGDDIDDLHAAIGSEKPKPRPKHAPLPR